MELTMMTAIAFIAVASVVLHALSDTRERRSIRIETKDRRNKR